MLGKLPWKNESYSSLDLPGSNSWLLVVAGESRCLVRQFLKDIIDETVHNSHGLAGNTDIRMDLLENLEDVDLVGLNSLLVLLALLVSFLR